MEGCSRDYLGSAEKEAFRDLDKLMINCVVEFLDAIEIEVNG